MTNASKKSTTPESTVDIGIVSRGKYTFFIRLELPTRLLEDWLNPLAKNVHGTSAAKAKIGYGMPSDGTLASRPKNRLNTAIVKRGWITAQVKPSDVCLYRTWMCSPV